MPGVHVSSLPDTVTQADVEEYFSRHGPVRRVNLVRGGGSVPQSTNGSSRSALIEFEHSQDAENCIRAEDRNLFPKARQRMRVTRQRGQRGPQHPPEPAHQIIVAHPHTHALPPPPPQYLPQHVTVTTHPGYPGAPPPMHAGYPAAAHPAPTYIAHTTAVANPHAHVAAGWSPAPYPVVYHEVAPAPHTHGTATTTPPAPAGTGAVPVSPPAIGTAPPPPPQPVYYILPAGTDPPQPHPLPPPQGM
mmetsp:Transcript_48734/g.150485  ORF Transcript_48734/g.150485 Transcript_48734/m.150485 type:complete len:246 (-) Transcript_48734:453-1190(-)